MAALCQSYKTVKVTSSRTHLHKSLSGLFGYNQDVLESYTDFCVSTLLSLTERLAYSKYKASNLLN